MNVNQEHIKMVMEIVKIVRQANSIQDIIAPMGRKIVVMIVLMEVSVMQDPVVVESVKKGITLALTKLSV